MLEVSEVRRALVEYFRGKAEWRKGKAKEHPEDARNVSAADALTELAHYVEALTETDDWLKGLAMRPPLFSPQPLVFLPPRGDANQPESASDKEASAYGFSGSESPLKWFPMWCKTVFDEEKLATTDIVK